MQEINAKFDTLFDRLKEEKKEDGILTHDENKAFKDVLNVTFAIVSGVAALMIV